MFPCSPRPPKRGTLQGFAFSHRWLRLTLCRRRPFFYRGSFFGFCVSRQLRVFVKARADRGQTAVGTIRFLRVTTTTTMPNQPMAEIRPIALRNEFHELALNFFRALLTL